MSKFNLLDLIIKSDKTEESEPVAKSKPVSFPEEISSGLFSSNTATKKSVAKTSASPTKYLTEISEIYQRKFDTLNKDGYDFNEFFEAMSDLSPKTPETYKMAFHFAKKMDKAVDKDYLLSTADFYTNELTNLHDFNAAEGNTKLVAISNDKKQEKANLTSEIDELQRQVIALEKQVSAKNTELQSIEGKYSNQISDIEAKLAANTAAKDAILNSIAEIKNGIETNIN